MSSASATTCLIAALSLATPAAGWIGEFHSFPAAHTLVRASGRHALPTLARASIRMLDIPASHLAYHLDLPASHLTSHLDLPVSHLTSLLGLPASHLASHLDSPHLIVPATHLVAVALDVSAVQSAFVAYGHYLGFILAIVCLTVERLTVKPAMSMEEEKTLAVADSFYGIASLLIVGTGYLRVTAYGKGWEFYQHEPIFWIKLTLLAVAGAASFFPTVKIIQRSVKQREMGDVPITPMSEKLAARMTSIINAELLAFASIPLAATLMARGVAYAEWLPWELGAAPVVLALGGLGFKYVKEALDWREEGSEP